MANDETRKSRIVPLHGHLIEQGLLAYAKSRGVRPLFYDPARSRGGRYGFSVVTVAIALGVAFAGF
jgi:hypothetical protein